MKQRFLILSLAAIAVMGCSLFDSEPEWVKMWVSVDSVVIADSVPLGHPVTFVAICYLGDSRWELDRLRVTDSALDVWVKVRAKLRPQFRWDEMGEIHAEGTFHPDSAGNYTFHFWQSDSTSLDTTLVVIP